MATLDDITSSLDNNVSSIIPGTSLEGVLSQFDDELLNNENFSSLISSVDSAVIQNESFSTLVQNVDEALLADGSFTQFLSSADDSLLTSGEFTAALSDIDPSLLRQSAFTNLLASVGSELITDGSFRAFITSLDGELLSDGSFNSFLSGLSDNLLTGDFTETLSTLEPSVLRNGIFTETLTALGTNVLQDDTFQTLLPALEESVLLDGSFNAFLSELGSLVTNDVVAIAIAALGSEAGQKEATDALLELYSDDGFQNLLAQAEADSTLPSLTDGSALDLLETSAIAAIDTLIQINGLAEVNPDVRSVVDTYFDSTGENPTRTIDSGGFREDPVTQRALASATDKLSVRVRGLSEVQQAVSAREDKRIRIRLGDIEAAVGLPPEFDVTGGDDLETPAEAAWKYSGLSNVPGLLAGGVGEGAPPPRGVDTIADFRTVSRDSPIDIIIEGGTVAIEADYTVTVGDTFDFIPGGGGFDDAITEGLGSGNPPPILIERLGTFGVAAGVTGLQLLERTNRAFDVPFETTFASSVQSSGSSIG